MSDENVLADLRAIRKRLRELEAKQTEHQKSLGLAMLAAAAAAATFALTTATWAVEDGEDGQIASTLWGIVPGSWFALTTLPLLAVVCLTTLISFTVEPSGRVAHLVLVGLSLVTAGWVLFLGTVLPEDASSAPARWLTLIGVLVIAGAHLSRAGELRRR